MPLLSVIIVNFNGERLLADCLNSLNAQTFRDFEIVFVDNDSSDGSVTAARALVPDIQIVALGRNAGFAGGNNAGLLAAKGDLIVALNNDTECSPDFLGELVRTAAAHPDAGMIAPKILNFFDRSRIDSVGGLLLGPDGIAMGRGRNEIDRGQYDGLTTILMPSGCAALYRRAMLNQVGFFCEDFFAYCEDSDLGLRCIWAGWHARSAPSAVVFHKYSASSSTYSGFKLRMVERNHFFLAVRNFTFGMLLALPFWTLWRYALMAYAITRGSGKGRAGSSEGFGSLLRGFLYGNWEAAIGSFSHWRQRSKRSISKQAFRSLLRQNRVSLQSIILTE